MTKRTPRAPLVALLLALGASCAVAQTTGSTPAQDRARSNATAPEPRSPAAAGKSDIGQPGFDAGTPTRGSTGGATADTLPGARGSTHGTSTDMTTGADTSSVDKTKKTTSKKRNPGKPTARDGDRATPDGANASPSGATGNQGNPPTTGGASAGSGTSK